MSLVDISDISRALLITLFTSLLLIFSLFSWAVVEGFKQRFKRMGMFIVLGVVASVALYFVLDTYFAEGEHALSVWVRPV
ncbi:hypothetical protein [Marinicrinis lubricantis]|uniref:Uncharacterized protein n=1 Tax=Marinicrinis lubricantis TaxID=2086470 RepID=A0ABW1IW45_9BACL